MKSLIQKGCQWYNGPADQSGARSPPSNSASIYSEIADLMLGLTDIK